MELFEDFIAPPFGGDAETFAYEFGWLPFDWQRRAIFVASKGWPPTSLRKLAAHLSHCADEKEAKKCRS